MSTFWSVVISTLVVAETGVGAQLSSQQADLSNIWKAQPWFFNMENKLWMEGGLKHVEKAVFWQVWEGCKTMQAYTEKPDPGVFANTEN